MKCPGQDPRYWTDDVVSDVPCPNCGRAVEFFRDESSARCPHCGHRFRNPNLDLACAQWCAYAEECLGYAPDRLQEKSPPSSGPGALASRLIGAVKEAYEARQDRLAHALLVFQHAKELVSKEGGDPRVVLAAALLLEIDRETSRETGPADKTEETGPLPLAQILRHMRLDDATIEQVGRIVAAFGRRARLDSPEFAVVRDADLLARLTERRDRFDRLPEQIEHQLSTQTAKQRARALFKTRPDRSQ